MSFVTPCVWGKGKKLLFLAFFFFWRKVFFLFIELYSVLLLCKLYVLHTHTHVQYPIYTKHLDRQAMLNRVNLYQP